MRLAAAAVLLVVLLAASAPAGGASARLPITVYAAASLTDAFAKLAPAETYSFGGSNMLEAQIELGAPADVFASANLTLPEKLYAKRLCSKPVVFTRNALVLIVPKSNPAKIRTVADLARAGVKLDIAAAKVPAGGYTLQVLKNLGLTAAVLPQVVSRETDVREVLAKVALGEADAGFVYATDAKTVARKVTALRLPTRAQPDVAYGICVVSASSDKAGARAFVARVLGAAGQAVLRSFGFLPRGG